VRVDISILIKKLKVSKKEYALIFEYSYTRVSYNSKRYY